ncbi:MAG: MarR family transcriptional regulator [Methanobacteriota archaeon]
MSGPQVLEHATRDRIYTTIKTRPGIHYRALMSDLAIANGTLVHHLHTLEREHFIRRSRHGLHLRFYPVGPVVVEAEALSPKHLALLEFVRSRPGTTQVDVATALGTSRQALHYHVHGLAGRGLLSVTTMGRITRLMVPDDAWTKIARCGSCQGAFERPTADAEGVLCPHCGTALRKRADGALPK